MTTHVATATERSPRHLLEAQLIPGQGTRAWSDQELTMNNLIYRNRRHEPSQVSSAPVCRELTYRSQAYNTCRNKTESDACTTLTYRGVRHVKSEEEYKVRNDRQSYFSVARSLVQAQIADGNSKLAIQIWNEASKREMDIDRIINLMYHCHFHDDDEAMTEADSAYQSSCY